VNKQKDSLPVVSVARAGIIAALYITITLVLHPISYGPVQLRAAEALAVLPILFPEAIAGLFIGVFFANIFGGLGLPDILGGSFTTLVAAVVTYRFRHHIIAYLSPILFNAFLVSLYLHVLFEWPYWLTVFSIGLSQTLVVFGLGYPLIRFLKKLQEN
jgi:uncharacterized membrane protein